MEIIFRNPEIYGSCELTLYDIIQITLLALFLPHLLVLLFKAIEKTTTSATQVIKSCPISALTVKKK